VSSGGELAPIGAAPIPAPRGDAPGVHPASDRD
jgi:hypothetical protein